MSGSRSARYTPIEALDDEPDFVPAVHLPVKKRHSALSHAFMYFSGLTLTTIILIALLVRNARPSCPTRQHSNTFQFIAEAADMRHPCGNSSQEALQNGCLLDIMSRSWLPPSHYDEELTHDFLAVEDWGWWSEPSPGVIPNHKQTTKVQERIPLASIENGSYSGALWVSWRYHMYHCAFMWRKFHRDMLAGRAVDEYLAAYSHTEHCTTVLTREDVDLDEVGVQLIEKFPQYAVHDER